MRTHIHTTFLIAAICIASCYPFATRADVLLDAPAPPRLAQNKPADNDKDKPVAKPEAKQDAEQDKKPDVIAKPDANANKPKENNAQVQVLTATITGLRGVRKVQVRANDNQNWQWAKIGMKLSIGSEIRTIFGGHAQITIEPGQTITIGPLSTVKLLNAIKTLKGTTKTDIGLLKGRTRHDIEDVGEGHDAKVHSPGTTMAIRGTRTLVQHDHFTNMAISFDNPIDVTNKTRHQTIRIAEGVSSNKHIQPAKHLSTRQRISRFTNLDGISPLERDLIAQYPDSVRHHQPRQISSQATANQKPKPGALPTQNQFFRDVFAISINWAPVVPGQSLADNNLRVRDPAGAQLTPNNIFVRQDSPTHGQHSGNDFGQMGSGSESVLYAPYVIQGPYTVSIKQFEGVPVNGNIFGQLQTVGVFANRPYMLDAAVPEVHFCVFPKQQLILPGHCDNHK